MSVNAEDSSDAELTGLDLIESGTGYADAGFPATGGPIVIRSLSSDANHWPPMSGVNLYKNFIRITGMRVRTGSYDDTTSLALSFSQSQPDSVNGSVIDSCYLWGSGAWWANASRCVLSNSRMVLSGDQMAQDGTIRFTSDIDVRHRNEVMSTRDTIRNCDITVNNIAFYIPSGVPADGNRGWQFKNFAHHNVFHNNRFNFNFRSREGAGGLVGLLFEESFSNKFFENRWTVDGYSEDDIADARWVNFRSGTRLTSFTRDTFHVGLGRDTSASMTWSFVMHTETSQGAPIQDAWEEIYGDRDQNKWNTMDSCVYLTINRGIGLKSLSHGDRFRGNVIATNWYYSPWNLVNIAGTPAADSLIFEHNTIYNPSGFAFLPDAGRTPVQWQGLGNRINHNVFVGGNYKDPPSVCPGCTAGQGSACGSTVVQFGAYDTTHSNFGYNIVYSYVQSPEFAFLWNTPDGGGSFCASVGSSTNVWGDPLFVNRTELTDRTMFRAMDLHPAPGSPLISPLMGWPDGYVGAYSGRPHAYYIRHDGSNSNPGTSPEAAGAWKTIGWAASHLAPGDTVYVLSLDTLTVQRFYPTVSGTSQEPIVFVGKTHPDSVGKFPIIADTTITRSNLRLYGFRLKPGKYGALKLHNRGGDLLATRVVFDGCLIDGDVEILGAQDCKISRSVIWYPSADTVRVRLSDLSGYGAARDSFVANSIQLQKIPNGYSAFLMEMNTSACYIDSNTVTGEFNGGATVQPARLLHLKDRAQFNVFSRNTWSATSTVAVPTKARYQELLAIGNHADHNVFNSEVYAAGLASLYGPVHMNVSYTGTLADSAPRGNSWTFCDFKSRFGKTIATGFLRQAKFAYCTFSTTVPVASMYATRAAFEATRSVSGCSFTHCTFWNHTGPAVSPTVTMFDAVNEFSQNIVASRTHGGGGWGQLFINQATSEGNSGLFRWNSDRNCFYAYSGAPDTNYSRQVVAISSGATASMYPVGVDSTLCLMWRHECMSRWGSPAFVDTSLSGLDLHVPGTSAAKSSIYCTSGELLRPDTCYAGRYAPADNIPPCVNGLFTFSCSQTPSMQKLFTWSEAGDDSCDLLADSVFICEDEDIGSPAMTRDLASVRKYTIAAFKAGEPQGVRQYPCVPGYLDVYGNGCGTDAVALPGNEIGYYMVATKDYSGNWNFSRIILGLCPP